MALEVVVTMIILLVVAVVILLFFANGIQPGVDMTNVRNTCINMATTSCQAFKTMPPTWDVETINDKGVPKSCATITGIPKDCARLTGTGGSGAATISTSAGCVTGLGTCLTACAGTQKQIGTCGDNAETPKKGVCCK
jgi:hypothetical protein